MKDIIITPKRQRTELRAFLVCFVIAFLLNVGAVIAYAAPAWELVTSIFYVLTFAVALYVAWVVVRLLYYGIKRLNTKNNK
jgi:nitrate reductase NapE component